MKACELRDAGKLVDAYNEFLRLAEDAADALDKAGATLYAADTLLVSGQLEAARAHVKAARSLIEELRQPDSPGNERFAAFELFLDYEEANLLWLGGGAQEEALARFEEAIKKHRLERPFQSRDATPNDLHARSFHEAIQIRRSFILCNLDRWREALPMLEEIKSPSEYKEGVAFYLGHCYVAAADYVGAEQKLTEALRLGGLPNWLEYRAHCDLGIAYYHLADYFKAKEEFEKSVQIADTASIKEYDLWRWLELACLALGLKAEAQAYSRRSRPS